MLFRSIGLTNFYLILKSLQNIQALTEGDCSDRFADLRGSAPHRGLFAAGVRNFDRRGGMMKTNIKPNRENQHHRRSEKDFSDQAETRNSSDGLKTGTPWLEIVFETEIVK